MKPKDEFINTHIPYAFPGCHDWHISPGFYATKV